MSAQPAFIMFCDKCGRRHFYGPAPRKDVEQAARRDGWKAAPHAGTYLGPNEVCDWWCPTCIEQEKAK